MPTFLRLTSLVLAASTLAALPEGEKVAAGQADFHAVDEHSLKVITSDKAIINYSKFNIGEKESVRFDQPSAKSSVLNRVTGKNPSKILGNLSSNGRVFLVNPSGIYFGPSATVNVGSFVASTLNIRDDDFLSDRLRFFQEPGSEQGSIVNAGMISASPEGFVALFAPFIENHGSILARAGKVVLAAAERVTLDFSGDGLIQFTVDGDLKQALIENYGRIEAASGAVQLSLRAAKDAIKMVVNTDGIVPASGIEEVNGMIRLIGKVIADQVLVEGEKVDVQGWVDASSADKKGGIIQVLGDHVSLRGAQLNASGDIGGGEILVGGGYQGKELVHNAKTTVVDSSSTIYCDAYRDGDGGKVIVWADDTAWYDGQIFARGGSQSGNGGLVETSGKENLHVCTGNVNTLSPSGKIGSWLMDPSSIAIARNNTNQGAAGLTTAATCTGGGFNLNDTTINNAASTVVLCTAGTITYNNNAVVNITTAGVGISHGAASNPSNITFQTGGVTTWSITTNNGPLTFSGPVTIPTGDTMSLNTSGGNISFATTVNGAGPLTINAGAGTTTFTGAVGGTTALTSISTTSATITQSSTVKTTGAVSYTGSTAINVGGSITTSGGIITMTGPVVASGSPTFDSTNAGGTAAGANINFTSTLNGATAVSIRAGTAGIAIFSGAVGGTTPLTNLSFVSASLIRVGSDITVSGANPLTFPSAVSLTGNSVMTSNNANINFNSTLDGTQICTITGGSGTTTFTGAVGGTAALTSLSATAATITQSLTAKTTGALSYTGSTAINIAGNVTTAGGIVTMTGPVVASGSPTFDSTNAGGTPAGANINFTSTLNGATAVSIRAGTGGTATLSGAVGGTAPLTNLSFVSANLIQVGNNITVTGANPLVFPSAVSLTGTSVMTSNNANITFSSTLNGAQALTLAGGSGITTFTGAVGGITALASLSTTAATINQNSIAKTTGALSYTGSTVINVGSSITTSGGIVTMTGPVTIANTPTIDTTNGGGTPAGANISFSNTLNGATALTLTGGTGGTVAMTGAVGGGTALTSLTATGATITQSSTARTTGALSYTGSTAINIAGNVTTSGGVITMTGPVVASGNPTFDSTNAGAAPAGASINFTGTLNGATAVSIRAGTGGTATFSGAIGGSSPLTNLSFVSANLIQVGNNITVTGANPLVFPSAVSLTGTSVMTSNNANITFNTTLSGVQALTLAAGTGSVTFTGTVGGGGNRLTTLTVSSATNVTANTISAGAIVQSAGSGTTTFNGPVDTNGASGISLTGTNFAINNNITTTNNGPLTINHTGSLIIAPGVALSISGAFNDNGSGAGTTNLVGSITTNGQNITFANPVLLVGTASLNTGSGVGNILFSNTLNGLQTLNLASGNGNITFSGIVGGTTPLGTVTITGANNVTAGTFSAAVFNQTAGTGTSTFNGPMALSGASGFSFVGTNATLNNSLTTANGGPANIQVSNNLVLSSSAALSLDGAFTQTGAGSDQLAGSITTTNDNISFAGSVTLSSTTMLNTGAGIGDILFSSTVDGPGALTMTAGTGNITLSAAAGSVTRVGAVTINSATTVSTQAISAASINQAVASTTATYTGNLNTNAVAGITLRSGALTVNGNLITTNAGPVSLIHAGTLALTAGASTLIDSTFTESGTGGVNLSGTVATNNAAISFANAIALQATTSINSGAGAGSINFSSTINGGQNLTVASGTGNTVFGGTVGNGTPLNNLTITVAGSVTATDITAGSLVQLNGSGTTTFNGPIHTSGVSGVSLAGTSFTMNNTVTTAAAGPVSIANSGLLNVTSSGIFSVAGAFTQSNTGAVTLSGQITAGGAIAFAGPITLSGSPILSTAAASQNITLANTVDGGGSLTLAAGGGSIALQSAVGSGTRIGALTIASALNVGALGISASSILQQAGTGTTTVNGNLNTNGASGISFALNNFTQTGGLITTNAGSVTVTNGGTYTLTSSGTTIDGFYLQNGAGPVSYAGTLQTNNQPISFSSPITLTGDGTLTSGGGNITLSGTVNGAHLLALAAGGGDILLSSIIGGVTPLTSLTFSSAHNITAQNAITAQGIVQSAGSGTSIFNGTVSTSTINGIVLTGSAFQFNNTVTTTNAGVFTLSNNGTALFAANFTIDGVFTQSGAGGVSLGASLATTGNNMTIGSPITLTANSALSSGVAGSGILTLSSTVDGAHTLSLTGGSGNIVVSGAIGSGMALTSLTASGGSMSLANVGTALVAGVSGAMSLTAISNLNFTGTNYNAGTQTYSGALANITGTPLTTFTSSGSNINFSAVPLLLGTSANLTINSGGGAITLNSVDAGASSGRTVTLNSGSGAITLHNVGTAGNGEIASLSLTGGDLLLRGNMFVNAITMATNSPHIISLGGDITTVGTPITFPNNVNVTRDTVNNATLTTNGGNITFQGKIDGDLPATRTLTVASGSGDVFFNNNIGDSANLNVLTITSAHNVTTAAVSVGSIVQSAGTGTTTFGGQVTTTTMNGLNLTGTNFTFLSGVDTTTGSGNFSVSNSGTLLINSGVIWNLGGTFTQTTSGAVQLAVHIDSNSGVSFAGPVTLMGTTNLDTSASAQQIVLGSTVIGGGFDLFMDVGTSSITVGGAISGMGALVVNSAQNITTQSISASSINLTWGTGTFAFTGALNTTAPAGIVLTGTNVFSTLGTVTTSNGGPLMVATSGTTSGTSGGPTIVSGSITQASTGTGFIGGTFISLTGNITTAHNIHLNAPLIVDTSAGGGNIIVQGTVDGPFPLTFKAGAGNITLQQSVGAVTPIGALTINNAANVTTQDIHAASITQLAGTGTTTFNGALTTTGAAGISITTNSIVRGAAITTTDGGPCSMHISNAGTFTSTAAGTITTGGAFTQTGTGAVSFGGTINVSNNNISFAGPITLSADALLNPGALAGDTTLSSTVQGAQALRVSGGAGSATFGGNIGTVLTPLTSVIIDNAFNVTTQAIIAGFIQQGGGTGTSTFNGALTTSAAAGIDLNGAAFAFNAPFTTTGAGSFTLTNSGTAIMSAAATGSVVAFVQDGPGITQLSNAITATSGSIQFFGPVTLSTTASLTTTNQPISLSTTLDSSLLTPGSLTVSSGTGDFTIVGNAGLSQPLVNLVVSTARNVTTQAISAASITQSAGTGTTLFNSDLTTTGAGGINLVGTAFTFLGNATTSGGGPIAIANNGTLTTTVGTTLLADGGFSQTIVGGAVHMASDVSASNNNISFAGSMTLFANVVLTAANDITVSTVDGGFDLTFTPGRDIFAGIIGGGVRLGAVTATTVRNNHASSITAATIVQLAGTGTTTLNGNIDTNTAAGINLVGTNFTRSGSIITTSGGSFVATHTGLITGTSINTTSIDGSYTANGVGPSAAHNLAGSITAKQGITISSPITLLSDPGNLTPVILDTSSGNGNISVTNMIDNDVNAPHKLILRSGGGSVSLGDAVGSIRPIGPLVFGNVNTVTAAAITAASIGQEVATTITGSAAFNGAVSTQGSTGIVLTGANIAFNNDVTTASSGPMTLTVSNQLTLGSGFMISLDGPFSQSGAGSVLLGDSITTTNDNISFASAVNLIGITSLNTNVGIGDITFSSSIGGAFPLTLAAGTGDISFQGSIAGVTALTANSAATILANSSIAVAGPIALTTAGALTFNSSVTTTASGSITLANGGTLTITSPIISASSLTQNQTGSPTTFLNANLTSSGNIQMASNTTLTTNVTMNSGGGAINLGGTIDSDLTARNLTLIPGAGSITLSGALGGVNPLAAFQITNGANVTATDISAATITQLTATGHTHFTGTLTTTALGGVSLSGNQFTFDDAVTTTGGGPLSIVHTGTLRMNAIPALGSHSLSGLFSESGGGGVLIASNMTLSNQPVTFNDGVTLMGDVTITSGNGNITFLNSTNGSFCLVLSSGSGTIALDGPVSLGCLTATGANILQNNSVTTTGAVQETGAIVLGGNITTTTSNITLTGNVSVVASATLSTGSGGGTIHITGSVNPDLSTRNFTLQTTAAGTVTFDSGIGTSVSFNNFTINSGTINWNNFGSTISGAIGTTTLTAASNLNFTGTTYTGAAQSYTAGGNFNLNGGALTTITSEGDPITFVTGTIELSPLTDLTINSNGGNVTLTDLSGLNRILNISAALGTVNVAHIGQPLPLQCLNAINITSAILNAPFATCPAINFTPTAPTLVGVNQLDPTTYNSPVIITADNITFSFSTCPGGNNIIFNSTLDSDGIGNSRHIVFDMCGNTLTFNGTVGGTVPLTSITVNDDSGVNVNRSMTVGSYTQSTSRVGATSTFASGLTTTSGDMNITSPNITLQGSFAIAGTATLNNSGTLQASGVSCNATGAFQQTGTGGVTISGTVHTSDNPISFHGPVTLNADFALNTVNTTGGNITFDNTVFGHFNTTFTAGTGDITLSGDLGTALNRMNDVMFVSDHNATTKSIYAATVTQLAGTGTISLVGTLDTNGPGGIHIIGNNISRNGATVTSNGGNLVVTNAGTITGAPGNTVNLDGAYIQNGSTIHILNVAGTINARTGISFVGPLALIGPAVFDTSSGGGNIIFNNTIDGIKNVTVQAGAGNVSFASAVGGGFVIDALFLGNLHDLTAVDISASSISQLGLTTITGVATFNGALSTSGATGIVLAAPEILLNNNVTTTGSGPLTLTDTNSLQFASGIALSLTGAFSESGGGAVSLAGSMTAASISFGDAVTLGGAAALTAGSTIAFSSTLDGSQSLDLTAGGSISFGGSVGSPATLGSLTIHNVNGITYPAVIAASINQMANSGTTIINGPIQTTDVAGIAMTGGVFTQNGTITTTNLGNFTINHSGMFTMAPGSGAMISGSYTDSLSSTGTISARGVIAAGGSISLGGSGAIALAAATTLTAGSTSGNITVNGTIDDPQNLLLSANGGFILLAADIGVGSRIGALTISSAANVDTQKIKASSLVQSAGSGTTHFHDIIDVTGGISLTGFAFTFDNTVTSGAGITLDNTDLVAFNTGANVSAASDFLLIGTGPIHLANTITTTSGQIQLRSDVTLTDTSALDSSAGNQPILLTGFVDGDNAFSLASGSGNITALKDFGSGAALGPFSLSSTGTVSMQAVSSASILQTGSAATTYSGSLNASGTISLMAAATTLLGDVMTTGSITLANSGLLTTAVGTVVSGDGGFSQTGAGAVDLGSSISTHNTPISFVSAVNLKSDVVLNSGSGGANITVDTVDGAFALTFTAGAGDITAGIIGGAIPLTSVIATTVHDIHASDITAGTIQQFAGSGTTTLNGDITSTSSVGITLVGTNFSRAGQIITLDGGNFVVTNSGLISGTVINTTSIDGSYIQNGSGTTRFAGTITARQGISFLGPIVMVAGGTFNTSSGNGPITLTNTIENFDLITPHPLTINAGTGSVIIQSPIGASQPLSNLKITGNSVSIHNIGTQLAKGLTGTLQIPDPLSVVTPNQILFTGSVVNANAQTYSAITNFNMNAGAATAIFSNGQPITFSTGTIQLAASTNLTINSVLGATGGNITTANIHAGAGSLRTVVLNAGTAIASPGTVQPGTIGTVGGTEFASVLLIGVLSLPQDIAGNAIAFTPTGGMTIGGNLRTINTNLTFPTAVTLTGSKTFATGGGTISFASTLDGDANDTRSLMLAAGAGDIVFGNGVGGTFRLNTLAVANARNITATAAGASITANAFLQGMGTGTTEFSRAVLLVGAGGIQFAGQNLKFDSTSTLTTQNNGPALINNTGTFTLAGGATLSGGLMQSGTGGVAFSGSIVSDQPVSFAAPVTLTLAPSIDTSAGAQSITFSNVVNGPGGLSLTAGMGDIAMNGTIGGGTPLGTVTIVSADEITLAPLTAGSLTFTNFSGTANYQTITTTDVAGVSLKGNNFIRNGALNVSGGGSFTVTNAGFIRGFNTNTTAIDGSYTQNGTGPYELAGNITVGVNISLASAVTLMSPATLTTTGNGTITLSSTVDKNQNLSLSAGTGTINLNDNIGITDRIGTLTINSAGTVSTQAINASSIVQMAGSGTTTFGGDLNTNGTSGIVLSGTHFVRGANWTTTNSGPITITIPLGGTLMSTAAGTINSAGAFRQLGSGSVSLSRTINTASANILFTGPVSLAGTTTLNTGGVGPGDISFNGTLDDTFNLNLSSGTGNISMQGAVGTGTQLGVITVNNANNVTCSALKATAFSQTTGSGTTTLSGPTNITTAAGISINATHVTLGGTLTTTTGGGVTINNSGLLTVNASCSVDGSFTQVGIGAAILSGAVTSTTGLISFSGAASTLGTPQLTTSSQPISFSSTLAGTGNIILNAGAAGDISFASTIGTVHPMGSILISNARNVSMNAVQAGSITQSTGAGTTSILGTINISDVAGINLLGNIFNINGSIITTNSAPISINHGGRLTLIAGPATLIDGSFVESGIGPVSLSGNLHTNSADITFHNQITLLNPTTLNSDGAGDITLSSPVDGATDLTLDSGTNNIIVLAPIGGATPINHLTIVDTHDATFVLINAQTLTQLDGSGTTTFNGAVTTSLSDGIDLTGNAFSFNAPVVTTGSGAVVINNAGTLNIGLGGSMNLTGPFSQIGPGSVTLSADITIDNDSILFTAPVTLGGTVNLMTSTATGDVTFLNTLGGTQNLTIDVGTGAISFGQAVGNLGNLMITSAATVTSQAITATAIDVSGISHLATFGALSTTSGAGIVLAGEAFTFNQDVTTTSGGPLIITNNGALTFDPTHTVTLDGLFHQNGTGLVLAGGNLTTHNQTVNFSSAVLLNGNYSINTGGVGANVTLMNDLDGSFNFTIAAGGGDVSFQKAIGDGIPLQSMTISTAHDISLNGVGTFIDGVIGTLNLTASNLINLSNSFYTAETQVYSAGTAIHFNNGALTNMTSLSGSISFTSGPIILSTANDLSIVTQNGALSYISMAGTTFENIAIHTGMGTAFMNSINGPHINNVLVDAGQIEFVGPINAVNTDFESLGAIFNAGPPVAINSLNIATFNALNGDVGTLSNPIIVNSSNQIFAGAGGKVLSLADFNGTSSDNTVHVVPSNPPCKIIFNGIVIKDCTAPPVPPTPPVPNAPTKIIRFPFAVPGVDSSYFNLASDLFFLPYFFDETFVHRDVLMYYRVPA